MNKLLGGVMPIFALSVVSLFLTKVARKSASRPVPSFALSPTTATAN